MHAHLFHLSSAHSKFQPLENVAKSISVDQVKDWSTIPRRFAFGVWGKATGRNKQPFVSSADHRASKVSNCCCSNSSLVAFALKEHVKTKERNPQYSNSVYPSIATSPCDFDPSKP